MAGVRVDGVPFLRAGREGLAQSAAAAQHTGDEDLALSLLLRDADDWWDEAPPSVEQAAAAVAAPTLRQAMALLRLGRVGDYFAHRWSDPVFLAGLALLRHTWPGAAPTLEIACGTGALLREIGLRGAGPLTGVDIVFAKVWLARRFVMPVDRFPDADFHCFDAGQPWPLPERPDGLVLCHDAIYFLPDPGAAAQQFRALAGSRGSVVIGGVPNALLGRPGGGHRLTPSDLADLLPGCELFDDADLVRECVTGEPAHPRTAADLARAVTVSAVWRGPAALQPKDAPDLGAAVAGRPLRTNPLYGEDGTLTWPSERYAADYADRSGYLPRRLPSAEGLVADPHGWARRRVLLDLPEAW